MEIIFKIFLAFVLSFVTVSTSVCYAVERYNSEVNIKETCKDFRYFICSVSCYIFYCLWNGFLTVCTSAFCGSLVCGAASLLCVYRWIMVKLVCFCIVLVVLFVMFSLALS